MAPGPALTSGPREQAAQRERALGVEDRGREDTGHRPRVLGWGLQGVKEEGVKAAPWCVSSPGRGFSCSCFLA